MDRFLSHATVPLFLRLDVLPRPPCLVALQAKDMYTALVAKGCPTALLEFPEEGHGFKDSKTIKRALEAELYFYGRVFGFEVSFVDPSIDSGDLNEAGYVFQKYHIDNLDDKPPEGYDFQNQ